MTTNKTLDTLPGKIYKVGRFDLLMPLDHMLSTYQSRYRLYDRYLGSIAGLVVAKYPNATMIDIGANVGDTAALICSERDIPVLCIEGNPVFIPYLRANIAKLPWCSISECLLGNMSGFVSSDSLKTKSGTASLTGTASQYSGQNNIPIRTIEEVLADNIGFKEPRLIKSDTDGSDFEILMNALSLIDQCRPVLFFEYDPTFRKEGLLQSVEVVSKLCQSGYCHFFVYDNFGNFLTYLSHEIIDRFKDLNRYIMSNLFFGRQIYYFDVCAMDARDDDLAEELLGQHRRALDNICTQNGWGTPEING